MQALPFYLPSLLAEINVMKAFFITMMVVEKSLVYMHVSANLILVYLCC